MKLTILGAGTGVAQLPNLPNRFPPGFLVEWGSEKVLFDCSEGVRFRLEDIGCELTSIRHIAISHPHQDHCALAHFVQAVFLKGIWGRDQFKIPGILVYCPQEMVRNFPALWNFHVPELEGKQYPWAKVELKPMPPQSGEHYTIGNGQFTAREVYHAFGKCGAVAFRLETPEGTFVYSGDTGECPGIREIAKNADIFVCEASAPIKDVKGPTGYGHLTPFVAGDIAAKAAVKKLVLFHHTGLDSDEAIIAECRRAGYKNELTLGKDFQVIKF